MVQCIKIQTHIMQIYSGIHSLFLLFFISSSNPLKQIKWTLIIKLDCTLHFITCLVNVSFRKAPAAVLPLQTPLQAKHALVATNPVINKLITSVQDKCYISALQMSLLMNVNVLAVMLHGKCCRERRCIHGREDLLSLELFDGRQRCRRCPRRPWFRFIFVFPGVVVAAEGLCCL